MVNVCPAIVAVPLRDDAVALAATVMLTVPLPLPLAPLAIVSHDVALDAVQEQPAGLVTETVSVSPPATALPLPGVME